MMKWLAVITAVLGFGMGSVCSLLVAPKYNLEFLDESEDSSMAFACGRVNPHKPHEMQCIDLGRFALHLKMQSIPQPNQTEM